MDDTRPQAALFEIKSRMTLCHPARPFLALDRVGLLQRPIPVRIGAKCYLIMVPTVVATPIDDGGSSPSVGLWRATR